MKEEQSPTTKAPNYSPSEELTILCLTRPGKPDLYIADKNISLDTDDEIAVALRIFSRAFARKLLRDLHPEESWKKINLRMARLEL